MMANPMKASEKLASRTIRNVHFQVMSKVAMPRNNQRCYVSGRICRSESSFDLASCQEAEPGYVQGQDDMNYIVVLCENSMERSNEAMME